MDTTTGAIAQRLNYDEFGQITLDTTPGFRVRRGPDSRTGRRPSQLLSLASLYEFDKERKFISGMGVATDGSVMLFLADRTQQSRAELRVPRGGLPRLRFVDKDEKVLWSTP